MKIAVVNLSAAASRFAARLPENPGGLPVKIGWDGRRIALFSGVCNVPAKSLPNERVVLDPWLTPEEIESLLAKAVARLLMALPAALSAPGRRRGGGGKDHHWKRGAVDRMGRRE